MESTVPKLYTPLEVLSRLQDITGRAFPNPTEADEAAVRAFLRHGLHVDDQHTEGCEPGGMHRNYSVL
jgi:hypothetical protein